ncbi:hypothetical protein AB0I81_22515 [Nonomuraea sp. NPDC050404]|uniref:hypothetical protein n=1 Tax=Nonomuraea sp. NPDC050404 TaxID=3155783 RepID=UPI0033D3F778
MTYTYTDVQGRGLTIEPAHARANTVFVEAGVGANVHARDLPKIVRELYMGTGQEPPIVLSRYVPQDAMTRAGKVRAGIRPDGKDLDPAGARHIAAWYATAADLAEAETEAERAREREQVDQLTAVVKRADPRMAASAEAIARAVLAAGYTRSES